MYLLYVDDAGDVRNRNEKHFVLAGVALFEAHGWFLQTALDRLTAATGLPTPETLELHGNEILSGRNRWRAMRSRDDRRAVIKAGLEAAFELKGDWRLFGVVLERAAVPDKDPVAYAFEQLVNRFDLFLQRKRMDGREHKGLLVLDKSTQETRLQGLATTFRTEGHSWGRTRNLADVPFFVDSRATRLVQYADLVTYALWRAFEKDDWDFYNVIANKFDREGGTVHGLLHERFARSDCPCAYCLTRKK